MSIESAYVFPAFCYFTRAGSVLCAPDGFDEAVPETTPCGLLTMFGEVAQVLSAESAVVMTTRVSFLEDCPPTRSLIDGTHLISEKLTQQLHAEGVKIRAASSVALTRGGNYDAASTQIQEGSELARQSGYRGGLVWCQVA